MPEGPPAVPLLADLKFLKRTSSSANDIIGACSITSRGMGSRNLSGPLEVSASLDNVSSLFQSLSCRGELTHLDEVVYPYGTTFQIVPSTPLPPTTHRCLFITLDAGGAWPT